MPGGLTYIAVSGVDAEGFAAVQGCLPKSGALRAFGLEVSGLRGPLGLQKVRFFEFLSGRLDLVIRAWLNFKA